MELKTVVLELILIVLINAKVIKVDIDSDKAVDEANDPNDNFNGVYIDCFLHMSFPCVQRKTLMYLQQLNNLSEVSVIGDYKRKGGGGGGGGGGHDHDGGDGFGKKKMMMMAMMCMKMKLMMMVPAMMGMMGMMSFKGMMFSMMSFMLAKGWATGGGGGGAWMPAGGPDYGGGGGGGGGYDANGQWQSRSILDLGDKEEIIENKPIITYVAPVVRYNNNKIDKKTNLYEDIDKTGNNGTATKSRRKRSIIDLLGINNNRRTSTNYPKYKIVNGVKYVFYPYRQQKVKLPKEIQSNRIKTVDEGFKPIITAEDFNKGEIVEGAVESRMNRKKMNKMKETVNDTIDENPWE
ncbi:cuticular protein CPG [Spodoptera litura]|uniref:Cuticular protein CPG n=1 Tax=Spodoptera litura TaxID=69820 RepID=A0A4V6DVF7_SPOLT|nr:cuticular protein CPG [Spodoptera litura]